MEAATDLIINEANEVTTHSNHRGSDIGQDDLNEMMHETFAASGNKASEAIDVPSEEEVRNPEPEAGTESSEAQKSEEGSAPANDENNMTIVEQMEQAKQ